MNQTEKMLADLFIQLPLLFDTIFREFEPAIPLKLNPSEVKTLIHIFTSPGKPMSEYSKHVGLLKGSFTTIADLLEKKGLILREASKEDRREICLILTQNGEKMAQQMHQEFVMYINQRMSNLNGADKVALCNAMQTLLHTVDLL